MMESELRRLQSAEPDHRLDSLVDDVWRGISRRQEERAQSRRIAALQGGLVLVSIVAVVALGIQAGRPHTRSGMVLLPGFELMPSNLLLPGRP